MTNYTATARAYVPELKYIILADEGTGDNLLPEDIAEGYVDYVYYNIYAIDGTDIEEVDGGMMLLYEPFTERYADKYGDDIDAEKVIQEVIEFHFLKNLTFWLM